jgi:hypothetical protein
MIGNVSFESSPLGDSSPPLTPALLVSLPVGAVGVGAVEVEAVGVVGVGAVGVEAVGVGAVGVRAVGDSFPDEGATASTSTKVEGPLLGALEGGSVTTGAALGAKLGDIDGNCVGATVSKVATSKATILPSVSP